MAVKVGYGSSGLPKVKGGIKTKAVESAGYAGRCRTGITDIRSNGK